MAQATREDFVRFVSDVRLLLEGPDGSLNDVEPMMQQETLIRLNHKLARMYAHLQRDPMRPGPKPPGPPRSFRDGPPPIKRAQA